MSFSRQSGPKRTSIANGRNARPLLSLLNVELVIRTRRSRGAGRAREKRLLSRSASGLMRPDSTRSWARSTMVGSSAGASAGIDDSAKAQTNGQWRSFTEHPSNVLDRFERKLERDELDDGNGSQDRAPKRDEISDVGVEPRKIQTDDESARDD